MGPFSFAPLHSGLSQKPSQLSRRRSGHHEAGSLPVRAAILNWHSTSATITSTTVRATCAVTWPFLRLWASPGVAPILAVAPRARAPVESTVTGQRLSAARGKNLLDRRLDKLSHLLRRRTRDQPPWARRRICRGDGARGPSSPCAGDDAEERCDCHRPVRGAREEPAARPALLAGAGARRPPNSERATARMSCRVTHTGLLAHIHLVVRCAAPDS